MTRNLLTQKDFKDLKHKTTTDPINEQVEPYGNKYKVVLDAYVEKGVINKFINRVKEETGRDIRQTMGEMRIA